jgi:hypothetical protein
MSGLNFGRLIGITAGVLSFVSSAGSLGGPFLSAALGAAGLVPATRAADFVASL